MYIFSLPRLRCSMSSRKSSGRGRMISAGTRSHQCVKEYTPPHADERRNLKAARRATRVGIASASIHARLGTLFASTKLPIQSQVGQKTFNPGFPEKPQVPGFGLGRVQIAHRLLPAPQ